MQEKAICPNCEIKAMMGRITKESIEASVAKMARLEGVTTEDGEYKRRLAVCEACPSLRDGILCAECGSYVAYRARIASSACPFPGGDKWRGCL
ncbi:MAG: hypothetical protein II837_06330 [Treponema sp.]|nr:hypothetical protein [Treponema sp.]MBQ6568380.1 hypothetical protein [Treponema sp.]MBQ7165847.1 hypothetical protein [Treponema sp.]